MGQVRSKADLVRVLDDYNVGDEVILKVIRDSESLEVPLKLEETNSWFITHDVLLQLYIFFFLLSILVVYLQLINVNFMNFVLCMKVEIWKMDNPVLYFYCGNIAYYGTGEFMHGGKNFHGQTVRSHGQDLMLTWISICELYSCNNPNLYLALDSP